ncbi:sprouty-related, EVH1 domain-containing protein 2 isoform X2 [Onthophagus taurus]|uniref:sprouty-related, EVH1 domain-containing protein 2 isoform X2 n=1 Tax=Onthophagus taurus TaxID=166361 RepID=UPI000C203770|nr:sprouty-related, EVH1 domain-containing protein 1 isoform X2 [Onthophagus taurus]
MTDSSEDGNHLVRVRAQVMSRDDSSGGWVPLEGGGLSNVSVTKKPRPVPSTVPGSENITSAKPKHDYLIYGRRISDQSIVLSCTIKKDFEYNKVMPTFHHWKTGDKKFGLTFQTAADARAFDKGVRTAVEELLDGFLHGLTETCPLTLRASHKDVGDDDVFMTLNLPQEPKDSRSSSDSSTKATDHLHKIHYLPRDRAGDQRVFEPLKDKVENYSYVQLTSAHEYTYPMVEDRQKPTLARRDSSSSLKKGLELVATHQSPYPYKAKKKPGKPQVRCKHCHDFFFEDKNRRGACEYAPDCVRSTINTITCIGCVQCLCYHCASDNEGDFAQHPCECNHDENCCRRWLCLTFLSMFVPCLWFYPPLRLCYWCGVQCGVCGGRHSTSM